MAHTMDELIAENARLRAQIEKGSEVLGLAIGATGRSVFALKEIEDRCAAQSVFSTDPQATLDDVLGIARAALSHPTTPQEGTRG